MITLGVLGMSALPIEVMTVAQLSDGQPWRLNLVHERPYHLFLWITRGQGRLTLEGHRRGVGTHNAISIPAGTLFSLELGRQSLGQAILLPDGISSPLPAIPNHLRLRDAGAITDLNTLIEAAQREAASERPLHQSALEAYVMLLSVWWQRQMSDPDYLPAPRDAAAKIANRFSVRIASHFRENMDLSDHAEAMNISAAHLSRACKAACGRSAAQLLNERQLHAAASALSDTQAPVQDIARHLGFGSAAYFTRFIKTHLGLSPRDLRSKMQGRKRA